MKKEEIFDEMITNKVSVMTIDPWVPGNGDKFNALQKTAGAVEHKGLSFFISQKSGGGAGMGEFPPVTTVTILHTF